MLSIYNPQDNLEIIGRLNHLAPNTQALWGKMTVDQMLQHTNCAILVAFGERDIKTNFLMRLFGKMFKKKIFNSEFKKNSQTANEFIFKESYDFEQSKIQLITNFGRFAAGHQSIVIYNHPFWGKMTTGDWDKLLWKHLDHHLKQFGV